MAIFRLNYLNQVQIAANTSSRNRTKAIIQRFLSFTAQDMGEDKPDAGFVDPISADKIGPGRKSRRVIVFPKRMCYTEKMGASLNKFNGENAV